MKSVEINELTKQIRKYTNTFIVGACCFAIAAVASIWFGYYVIRYKPIHDLPAPWAIIGLAGGLLLWEMIKSFYIKTKLPESYKIISKKDFPELFDIINEVTTNLGLSPVTKVYTCPDTTAAVFILPSLRNMILKPQRNLIIGLGFLSQMDDEEIRAVLYHEFGHYVQPEIKSSFSVYMVGQLCRLFTATRTIKFEGSWNQGTRMQLLIYTSFVQRICRCINDCYSKLAKQMEYDADDVAVKHVGKNTLQRALIHALCIRYNYEVMQWGFQQLPKEQAQIHNPYLALNFMGSYSKPPKEFLSREVIKRVSRLGKLESDVIVSAPKKISSTLLQLETEISSNVSISLQFARWLKGGIAIYEGQRRLAQSVCLKIHLANRKHEYPKIEARYKILLDEVEVGIGTYIKGYTITRRISPGSHTLNTCALIGVISIPFDFMVEADKAYQIEMDYQMQKNGDYTIFATQITEL